MSSILDLALLESLSLRTLAEKKPFPWIDLPRLLREKAFARLCEEFPSAELFEVHQGLERIDGQRPHDRLYLAYEESIYRKGRRRDRGVITHKDLSSGWAQFIEELTRSSYLQFIKNFLGDVKVRYAWHRGFQGSEVSPHRDGSDKLGSHIFYFNTRSDWNPAWGGETLILSGKSAANESPAFGDFSASESIQCFGNHSFLFQNRPDAWHGVQAIGCPEGTHRKLFQIVFERPEQIGARKSSGLLASAKNRFRSREGQRIDADS